MAVILQHRLNPKKTQKNGLYCCCKFQTVLNPLLLQNSNCGNPLLLLPQSRKISVHRNLKFIESLPHFSPGACCRCKVLDHQTSVNTTAKTELSKPLIVPSFSSFRTKKNTPQKCSSHKNSGLCYASPKLRWILSCEKNSWLFPNTFQKKNQEQKKISDLSPTIRIPQLPQSQPKSKKKTQSSPKLHTKKWKCWFLFIHIFHKFMESTCPIFIFNFIIFCWADLTFHIFFEPTRHPLFISRKLRKFSKQ